jgi:spore germination protein YaaH/flagellar hook assembly protein FlgD
MTSPHNPRPRPASLLAVLVGLLVLATGSLPVAAAEPVPAAEPERGFLPSIHYQDARAHAGDRITFQPGDRVEVGYAPRGGDTWQVGGELPRALPAGHVTGDAMALAPQGSVWADSAPRAVTVPAPGAAGPTPMAARGLLRQVFGFLPYWELSDSSTTLNYDVLSTIAYFSVGADSSGNLLKRNPDGSVTTGWGGWTSQRMTEVITAAHRKRTRVVLTLTMFAWTTGQRERQAALLGNPTARRNLARQAAAAVRDRGADGINLDFEPLALGYEAEFTALVRTMRAELDRIAPGYQLTFDTMGWIGNYPIEDLVAPGAADAIFIMGYDYRTAGTSPVGSIAPLGGPKYDIVDTIRAYTARVPASKLILGVPYYGRAWSTSSSRLNASNISGSKYGHSAAVVYANAMPLLAQHGRRWDRREKVAWTVYRKRTCSSAGCFTSWRQLYVDDATALRAKYDTVIRYGLRGAGMWALGYDDTRPELYQALAQKFLHDTAGPVAGIQTLNLAQREEAFAVRWSAYDISGVASYDVQVSRDGGAWANWRLATTRTSELYLGEHGHGYAFRARARDRKGNVGAWNVVAVWQASPALAVGGFGRVDVDGLAMRTGPSTGATKVGEFQAYQRVQVVDGPVNADGFSWWRVAGPITEWRPVTPLQDPVWVAEGPSGGRYLTGARAPHTTSVDAVVRGVTFGDAGRASLGAAGAGHRTFSPNGDGIRDTIRLRWTNSTALDRLELRAVRSDGTVAGATTLTQRGAGAQSVDFDGRLGGSTLSDGRYLLMLVGNLGGSTLVAPGRSVTATILATYGVTVDTVAPVVSTASASALILSPNGDRRFDSITFRLAATGATGWSFTAHQLVDGVPGAAVRSMTGSGPALARWYGRGDDGSVAPNGRYRVTLRARDTAGNAAGRSWDVTLDTRRPSATLAAVPPTITPNGDGRSDATRLRWSSDETVSGRLRVMRGTTTFRAWTITARTAGSITWGGRDGRGRLLPDGTYTIRLDLLDRAGNPRTTTTRVVIR